MGKPGILLQFLTISLALLQLVGAVQELFDAFDRKMFKAKKVRYATFDKQGILTLDGTLNGKSNDIVYPNGEESFMMQKMCNREPKLMFELCEMEKYGPWIGLAICYESQLSQPYINPFFRIKTEERMQNLTKVLCGERQNIIFINRVVQNREEIRVKQDQNASFGEYYEKYEPFYSIGASFTEEEILFKMPNDTAEKACAILHLGGDKGMLGVLVTDLRRQQLQLYNNAFVPQPLEAERVDFPDLANRKFRLSKDQGLGYLLLDFSPPYGMIQNISIYGWLPLKVKITGQSIKPCTLNWQLIQSREVSGDLVATFLQLRYYLYTGTQNSETRSNGTQNSTTEYESVVKTISASAKVDLSAEQVVKMAAGLKSAMGSPAGPNPAMISPAGKSAQMAQNLQKAAGAMQKKQSAFSLTIEASSRNTEGSENTKGEFAQMSSSSFETQSKVREETVQFANFQGSINIEQLVLECHGMVIRPDKIRYHDSDGNALIPDSVETSSPILDVDDYAEATEDDEEIDFCMDNVEACPIWAGQGECQKRKVFMLSRCKYSCGICKRVNVDKTYLRQDKERRDAEKGEPDPKMPPCNDNNEFCGTFAEDGLCYKNPLLMSKYCRKSCNLCIPREDAMAMDKELWEQEDGL